MCIERGQRTRRARTKDKENDLDEDRNLWHWLSQRPSLPFSFSRANWSLSNVTSPNLIKMIMMTMVMEMTMMMEMVITNGDYSHLAESSITRRCNSSFGCWWWSLAAARSLRNPRFNLVNWSPVNWSLVNWSPRMLDPELPELDWKVTPFIFQEIRKIKKLSTKCPNC